MKLGGDGDKRGGIVSYAFPGDSQVFKTATLTLYPEGMKLHFKYFTTNGGTLDMVVSYFESNAESLHHCRFTQHDSKANAWTDIAVPLANFKEEGGSATIPAGVRISRLEFWLYGGAEKQCYVDDIELSVDK